MSDDDEEPQSRRAPTKLQGSLALTLAREKTDHVVLRGCAVEWNELVAFSLRAHTLQTLEVSGIGLGRMAWQFCALPCCTRRRSRCWT
jgi:hypothetical protein